MAEGQGIGADGQFEIEDDFELVLDPYNKYIERWRPVLMQALAIAKSEDECSSIRAEICYRVFVDVLAEIRRCSRQEPEANRGSG